MRDQYWPDADPDCLPEDESYQTWPDDGYPSRPLVSWDWISSDPLTDIVATYAEMSRLYRTRAKGIREHYETVWGHTHLSFGEPEKPVLTDGFGLSDELELDGTTYKKLPNGRYMPVTKKSSGPPKTPFKKRGKFKL